MKKIKLNIQQNFKMKNLFIFLSIIIYSCNDAKKTVSSIKKPELKLEILNNEMYYADIDSTLLLGSENKSTSDIKSYSIQERKKAYNELTFKITNTTNKNYLFALKTNDFLYVNDLESFEKSFSNQDMGFSCTFFSITKPNSKKSGITTVYTNFNPNANKNDSLSIYFRKHIEIQENISNDVNTHINIPNYQDFNDEPSADHLFVIHSGEYKTFKRKFYLPIFLEKDRNSNFLFNALVIPPNEDYSFNLAIILKKQFILRTLHDYQKKEIKDNGYEIFDGILVSNSVPLKLRK
jgi:hypothetical protein